MGTWATPDTLAKAQRLAGLLARPLPASKAVRVLYDLVGDDRLFDAIDENRDSSDVRDIVARKLKEWDESYHEHRDAWRDEISLATWAELRHTYKKILARAGNGRRREAQSRDS